MAKELSMGEYLVAKVGLRKATAVATFVVAWGIYSEKVDAPHTLDGYSKFWRQSVATTYRERDLFRVCFPDDKVPNRVWALCRAVYDAKVDERRRELSAVRLLALRGVWS